MSVYVPNPSELDYVFRLQDFQKAMANNRAISWSPYVDHLNRPSQFKPPWENEYRSSSGGYFVLDAVAGRTYQFSSFAFFPPSIKVYDADGFEITGAFANDSYVIVTLTAKETSKLYVYATAPHAYAHSNANLVVYEDVDVKPNIINGTSGKDRLAATPVNDIIDGGAGVDFVTYAGPRENYTISKAVGTVTVTDKLGASGTDKLTNIERLIFSDMRVSLEVTGADAQAYRMYKAAFDRAPDLAGLGYWFQEMDKGLSLTALAHHFINSPEFVGKYGALNDTQFITQLYENVLHRAPDAEGLSFHVGNLANGVNSRAEVLVGFSESPENQAAIIGSIQNGIEYIL